MTVDTASIVLLRCPVTRELVPTGFWADSVDELEPDNELIDCPSCGNDHPWTPSSAIFSAGRRTG